MCLVNLVKVQQEVFSNKGSMIVRWQKGRRMAVCSTDGQSWSSRSGMWWINGRVRYGCKQHSQSCVLMVFDALLMGHFCLVYNKFLSHVHLGTTPETTEIWTHIWTGITSPPPPPHPFYYAKTFVISVLLVVCALRWYVKSLYWHLFLEDTSKHARVTKKWHFQICGKHNSKVPWSTCPQISVCGLLKHVAVIQWFFDFF